MEASSLIYNYPVTYTGLKNSSFVQCYLFKDRNNWNGIRWYNVIIIGGIENIIYS